VVCLGKCPDLITGIHGDDPVKLYAELTEIVADVVSQFEASGRPLPARTPFPWVAGGQAAPHST